MQVHDELIVEAPEGEREAVERLMKDSMEHVLRAVNQKEEGGEGRATEFVSRFTYEVKRKAG